MPDPKDVLEREMERAEPRPYPFASFLARRERIRRERRIAAGAVGIVAFGIVAVSLWAEIGPHAMQPMVHPDAPVSQIVMFADMNHLEFDPTTGRELSDALVGVPTRLDEPPAWSSEGASMAYLQDGALHVWNATTQEAREVGRCVACSGPAWSPDGTTIAVAHQDGLELFRVVDGATTSMAFGELGGSSTRDPAWTADGTRVAFAAGGALYSVSRDGSDLRTVLTDIPAGLIARYTGRYSPDASRYASISGGGTRRRCGGPCPLFLDIVDVAGGRSVRVEVGSCACIGFGPTLAWSPDGTRIAMITGDTESRAGSGRPVGLYVIDADGTEMRLLRRDVSGFLAWRA